MTGAEKKLEAVSLEATEVTGAWSGQERMRSELEHGWWTRFKRETPDGDRPGLGDDWVLAWFSVASYLSRRYQSLYPCFAFCVRSCHAAPSQQHHRSSQLPPSWMAYLHPLMLPANPSSTLEPQCSSHAANLITSSSSFQLVNDFPSHFR